jgi:hypothetical protein
MPFTTPEGSLRFPALERIMDFCIIRSFPVTENLDPDQYDSSRMTILEKRNSDGRARPVGITLTNAPNRGCYCLHLRNRPKNSVLAPKKIILCDFDRTICIAIPEKGFGSVG